SSRAPVGGSHARCGARVRYPLSMRFGIAIAGAIALAAMAADEKEVKLLPEGAGKDAIVKSCLECHGVANFRKARKDADEWADSVQDMVDRGAKATPAEINA